MRRMRAQGMKSAIGVDPGWYNKPDKPTGVALVTMQDGQFRLGAYGLIHPPEPSGLLHLIDQMKSPDAVLVCERPIPAWSGGDNNNAASTAKSGGAVWRTIGWVEGTLDRGEAELILAVSARGAFHLPNSKKIRPLRVFAEVLLGRDLPERGKNKVGESVINAIITAAGWLQRTL